jgi:hypothetical protein
VEVRPGAPGPDSSGYPAHRPRQLADAPRLTHVFLESVRDPITIGVQQFAGDTRWRVSLQEES